MSLRLKEGEAVRVAPRPVTPQDLKTGLYFNHYAGLTGTVFKIYGTGDAAQAAIDVDIESLPAEIAQRHTETRDSMLRTITNERGRNNADSEADFRLRYVILVAAADLSRKTSARQAKAA
jgi:hypothetical protein